MRIAGAAALLTATLTAALWLKSARPAPGDSRPGQAGQHLADQTRTSDISIHSAEFGAAGKVADVTATVVALLRSHPEGFTADAKTLGADPLPWKKKHLTLRYDYKGTNCLLTFPSTGRVSRQALVQNALK